jgi:calcineurin-like phosphoesterase family protein
MKVFLSAMVKGGRCRPMKKWGHRYREQDEYMLMLRVDDWKLGRKTEVFRSMVPDVYAFPPFQHITLFGPFLTKKGVGPVAVYNAIESASEGINGISFTLSGYLRLKSRRGQAITHRVIPSKELAGFHEQIWYALSSVACSRSWIDQDPSIRQFHITHGYNIRTRDADLICHTIKTCQDDNRDNAISDVKTGNLDVSIPVHAGKPVILPDNGCLRSLRVIILKNGVIEREFDLPAREWINRQLAYNQARTAVSLMQYRKLAGLELASQPKPLEKPPFLLSDLHLGHNNIIKYCRRPFNNAGEMDRVLIGNWNRTLREDEEILYLGDFRYGTEAPPSSEYLRHMNGRITFIRGNHDTDIPDTIPSLKIKYSDIEFLFIHNPDQVPPGFTGWVVHGHYHNNDLKKYPFINIGSRRVNVSCELTRYRPVSLDTVYALIQECSRDKKNKETR